MKDYILLLIMSSFMINAKPLMIAHAGGGIDGVSYSNSIEALNSSYSKGFRYFEMDFSWSNDGELVCLHDWGKRFKKIFGYKTKTQLSFNQFQQLLIKTQGLHPCTLSTLSTWVKEHKDAKIITDVKFDNIKAIKKIVQYSPNLIKQIIPQFYQPSEYSMLKNMGFKHLIWILYQYKGNLASVGEHAKKMDLFAISMRSSQAKKKQAQQLIKNKNNVFVYTINKQEKLEKLVDDFHVSGIYTDFLDINQQY